MGLETGTYISDLVTTNPISTDAKSVGDDHLRLLKSVLKTTFPNATKPFYFPSTVAKTANYTVLSTDDKKTFLLDTTAGSFNLTLPALAAGDAGWSIDFIKTNAGTSAAFILPASGTLTSGEISGLTSTRRCIPGRRCTAFWTGTEWFLTRALGVPVASILKHGLTTLPVGYEWANGTTLASAALYPDFNAVAGLGVHDLRGRVVAGKDDMGGVSANRLTGLSGGLNGDTMGAVGGAETHTNTSAQSGQKAITAAPVTITDPGHPHTVRRRSDINITGAGNAFDAGVANTNTDSATTGITAAFTLAGSDAAAAHNNVQPTIILTQIVVVE